MKNTSEQKMNKKHLHQYKNKTLTINELAELKGVSVSHMRSLVRQFGVDGAMDYKRNPSVTPVKLYQYNGNKMDVNQLIELAKVKCKPGTMHLRIKKYGVEFSIENDDFEKLKRTGHLNRKIKPAPDIPKYDPSQHAVDNMVSSLTSQGLPLCRVYYEVRRRLAA